MAVAAIPIILKAASIGIYAGMSWTAVLVTSAITAGVNYYNKRRMEKKMRQRQPYSYPERKNMVMRPNEPRMAVYGKARVGLRIVMASSNQEAVYLLGHVADHGLLPDIAKVHINGEVFHSTGGRNAIKMRTAAGGASGNSGGDQPVFTIGGRVMQHYDSSRVSFVEGREGGWWYEFGQRSFTEKAKDDLSFRYEYNEAIKKESRVKMQMAWDFSGKDGVLDFLLGPENLDAPFRPIDPEGNTLDAKGLKGSGMSWACIRIGRDPDRQDNAFGQIPNISFEVERSPKSLYFPPIHAKGYPWLYGTSNMPDVRTALDPYLRKLGGVSGLSDIIPYGNQGGDNAALCLYDYMVRYTPYGQRFFYQLNGNQSANKHFVEMIDHEAAWRAIIDCTNGFTLPKRSDNTRPKQAFSANGAVNLDAAPDSVIQQFLYAMNSGSVTEIFGKRSIHVGKKPSTAAVNIYRHDVKEGSVSYNSGQGISHRVTSMEGHYLTPEGDQKSAGIEFHTGAKVSSSQVDLLFVNNQIQADQAIRVMMDRSLGARTITFDLANYSKLPSPNDVVKLWGFLGMGLEQSLRCRVMSVKVSKDTTATIAVLTEDEALFDYRKTDDYTPPETGITPPPAKPAPPNTGDKLLYSYRGVGGLTETSYVLKDESSQSKILIGRS